MPQQHHRILPLLGALSIATFAACSHQPHEPLSVDQSHEALAVDQAQATSKPAPSRFLKPTSGIRGIFEDSKGNFYFTSTEWTAKYNPSTRNGEHDGYTYLPQRGAGVLVSAFQEDAQGTLWSQGPDGIFSYDGEQFTPIARDYDHKDQWAIADGDLWFGADGNVGLSEQESQWGVYRMHDGKVTFLAYPEPPPGERAKFYALTSKPMMKADGTLWFGTFTAAFGFDGKTWDILSREKMGRADDPRHIGYRGYHLDNSGNLWLADNGAGLYVYDGKEVIHFTDIHNLEDKDTDGNSLHRAFSVAQDNDGNYWFGAVYSGIWRYEPSKDDPLRKGTFTNFDDAEGWPCENAWTIYKTRSGELLFGGEDPGGVYRFDGAGFERVF